MAPPGEDAVGPQGVDDGDVAVQAHHDQHHGREVERERAQVREQLAGEAAGQPVAQEAPNNLWEDRLSMSKIKKNRANDP